jgi:hypothetical protein
MPANTGTRRSKSAPASADEAQQAEAPDTPVEGQPVDEAAERRRVLTQETINQLNTVIVNRMRGEMNPKFEKLQAELDAHADLLKAIQEAQGDGAGVMLEEDALADKISYAVEVWLKGMYGEEGTATGATLNERLDGLATALAQHQSDVSQQLHDTMVAVQARVNELAHDLQAARLGEASAHGMLRDVAGEQRSSVKGVYRKVHQLMLRIEEIGKGRQYRAESRGDAGNVEYSFRGIDDAMDAVGAGLRAVGLIMRSEVIKAQHEVHAVEKKPGWVQHWATTRLTMRYTFVDPDDGSEHAVEGYGVGKDLGDKDGSKASSAAMKYALFQGLCIPVKGMNIDPEADDPTDHGPAPEQQTRQQQPQRAESARREQPTGTPEERAVLALRAARAAQNEQELTDVLIQAQREDLMLVEVDGQKLQQHLVALRRTLRPADGGGHGG